MSNYTLPTYFEVNEELFEIRNKGDYRTVLSCFNILYDNDLNEQERLYTCLLVFYDFEDLDEVFEYSDCLQELIDNMLWFFDCGNKYDDNSVPTPNRRLVDWDKDETLIASAINNVAKTEIRAMEYLHWWTFISYYMAIGECSLATIVSIRSKIVKGDKLEKFEKKFKAENPQYFNIDMRTQEEKDTDEWLQSLWDGGSK